MATIILSALLISAIIYLSIGYSLSKDNKNLSDLFPVVFGKKASVNTTDEFSKSTVATTVSLATIVLAYFELAGYFGIYLLWTAITTAIGVVLVSFASKKIWQKMNTYDHRPSLHEFLSVEFNSPSVGLIASICTSIGFLLIFATELIVGSRFLAGLVPQIPEWVTVIFLSTVGFLYTLMGGFRAVIKTDQLQMRFIWGFIGMLIAYYIYHVGTVGWENSIANVPENIFSLEPRAGLGFFLFGIAVMNIPTHISNMSVWQRISGAQEPETVVRGFRKSIWGMLFSWGLLALLACFAFMIVTPEQSTTLLTDLLATISTNPFGKVVLFVSALGLYGAMLSTASTNLIVVTHTISEDVLAKFKSASLQERINSKREFYISRGILIGAALVAIFLVEGLKYFGFSIADLVFAIYGGALVLFPPIMVALYNKRENLIYLSNYVTAAVVIGFILAWGSAIYGRNIGDSNLVFLSPCVGIGISALIVAVGYFVNRRKLAVG